jgi:uncharacterized protein Yka (UPF0111/DUF47 family)
MKNLDLLLEGIQNIENQLVENGIIEDESIASEVIGELKEKLYREIQKKDLLEFHTKLQDLMDEYHHAIYLNDGIFKGF